MQATKNLSGTHSACALVLLTVCLSPLTCTLASQMQPMRLFAHTLDKGGLCFVSLKWPPVQPTSIRCMHTLNGFGIMSGWCSLGRLQRGSADAVLLWDCAVDVDVDCHWFVMAPLCRSIVLAHCGCVPAGCVKQLPSLTFITSICLMVTSFWPEQQPNTPLRAWQVV